MEIRDVGRECSQDFVREYVGDFLGGIKHWTFFYNFNLQKKMREVAREFYETNVVNVKMAVPETWFFKSRVRVPKVSEKGVSILAVSREIIL